MLILSICTECYLAVCLWHEQQPGVVLDRTGTMATGTTGSTMAWLSPRISPSALLFVSGCWGQIVQWTLSKLQKFYFFSKKKRVAARRHWHANGRREIFVGVLEEELLLLPLEDSNRLTDQKEKGGKKREKQMAWTRWWWSLRVVNALATVVFSIQTDALGSGRRVVVRGRSVAADGWREACRWRPAGSDILQLTLSIVTTKVK